MDADPDEAEWLIKANGSMMRTGRSLGRTLYLVPPGEEENWGVHLCVGMVDSAELADEVCRRWNTARHVTPESSLEA